MTKLAELKKRMLKNDEVRRGYEEAAVEFALSESLLKARSRAKMSQEDIARRMGTSQSVIARLEGGRVSPSVATLNRYAEAVGAKLKIEFIS